MGGGLGKCRPSISLPWFRGGPCEGLERAKEALAVTGHDSHGCGRCGRPHLPIASYRIASLAPSAMKSIKKSLVLFYSPRSLYFSRFPFSFLVAKIQILQKINLLNSHRPHPRRLPHYHPNHPLPFNHLSQQAPPITETITPFPRNHLHRPRAHDHP